MKTAYPEKRKSPRYLKKTDVLFQFAYDAGTKIKYRTFDGADDHHSPKFSAISKNIGATGLCFTSGHKLKKGQKLHLEIYLPKLHSPIHMDGRVSWCGQSPEAKKKSPRFDAGIKLTRVEGESVDKSVHLDKTYHIIWSNVLESIFGTFRKLMSAKAAKAQ